MATKIVTKNSSTASAVPTASDLVQGELAVNVADKRLFTEDNGGAIVELGTNPSTIDINAGTIDGTAIGASSASTGAFTTLTASGAFTSLGIDDNATSTAITIDSSENVGIGTSSPSYKTDILATNQNALRLNTTDADGCFLAIQTNGTAKGYLGTSHHLATGSPSENDITLRAENNLQFTTGGGTERMRITAAGALQLSDVNSPNDINTAIYSNSDVLEFEAFGTNGAIAFTTGPSVTERMRIDSSGNVGIGVSSPSANITIDKGLGGSSHTTFTTANSYLQLGVSDYNSSGGVYAIGFGYSGGATHSPAYIGLQQTETGSYTKGDLVFRTRSTSTDVEPPERMRIDASGNVGVGVSNPSDYYATNLVVNAQSEGGITLVGTSAHENYLMWADGTEGTDRYSGYISYNHASNYMRLGMGSNERMRIDSSGNLLVGCTALNAQRGFAVQEGPATNVQIMHNYGQASGTTYAQFLYATGVIGSITQSGTTAVLYNTSSDQRLKENIADADDAGNKIDAIQVRKYDWKADGSHQDYGMIAQELQLVAPEAVSGDADSEEMMGVDYSKLVPMMLKEIQSLRNRVAQLETGE